jgi:hypothetical protein
MNGRNDIRWAQNPPAALNNRFVIDSPYFRCLQLIGRSEEIKRHIQDRFMFPVRYLFSGVY